MGVELRNPYVILGVPFGASRDMASFAFAVRAKSLRRMPGGAEKLTELTWALNQVTEVLRDPEAAVDVYRIPADPTSLEPGGKGLFRPPPERMERMAEATDAVHELMRLRVAREALEVWAAKVGDRLAFPGR